MSRESTQSLHGLEIEHRDTVAVVTLVGGKAHALDLELCLELRRALAGLAESDVRSVVITGEGDIFSAGVDLVRLVEGGADYVERFLPAMSKALEELFFFPKPVIAALNGHAIAGGCVLACAADRRLMTAGKGRIGIPELRVGVPFPPMALEIMRFATDPRQLDRFVLSGVTVDPEEAVRAGLVHETVEPATLMDRAVAVAHELTVLPGPIVAVTKAQIRKPVRAHLEASASEEREVMRLWQDPETLAAVRDYVARTLGK